MVHSTRISAGSFFYFRNNRFKTEKIVPLANKNNDAWNLLTPLKAP
jgi:hypothetical protein